ncbi:hypothetical protein EJB05_47276 [Eragrostis curvula]|uniref:Uncharacterized protein n=1 Tax=Eragrostis curvula TaxID=38414 RepID=A0A5J9T9H2_9POAL|nr:hypothetical protein EJB05_47276 [Eragrostis curvula]
MRQEPNPGLNSSSSCLDDGFSPHTGDLGLRCSGFVPDGSGVSFVPDGSGDVTIINLECSNILTYYGN